MKAIKNMRELELMREKLKYQELLYEKELVDSSAELVESVTDKLKEAAIDIGTRLLFRLFSPSAKKKAGEDQGKKKKKE